MTKIGSVEPKIKDGSPLGFEPAATAPSNQRRYNNDAFRLRRQSEIPPIFHEHFILSGYRKPHSSAFECFLSAFKLNNETVNFWTHFIPAVYFAIRFASLCSTPEFVDDPYHWPYLTYLACVWLTPSMSAFAHLFNIISVDTRHLCFFLDYTALAIHSYGISVCYHAYSFRSTIIHSLCSDWFLTISWICSTLTTIFACHSRFVKNDLIRKVMRTLAFFQTYVFTNLPIIDRLGHDWVVSTSTDPAIPLHYSHSQLAIFALLAYGSHMPEAVAPGWFDYFGHSHQLFHIFAIATSYNHMWATHTDMMSRRDLLEERVLSQQGASAQTCPLKMALNVGLQLSIVGLFSLRLLNKRWNLPKNVANGKIAEAFNKQKDHHHVECSVLNNNATLGSDNEPILGNNEIMHSVDIASNLSGKALIHNDMHCATVPKDLFLINESSSTDTEVPGLIRKVGSFIAGGVTWVFPSLQHSKKD